MDRLLVGVDGSNTSHVALRWGLGLAARASAAITAADRRAGIVRRGTGHGPAALRLLRASLRACRSRSDGDGRTRRSRLGAHRACGGSRCRSRRGRRSSRRSSTHRGRSRTSATSSLGASIDPSLWSQLWLGQAFVASSSGLVAARRVEQQSKQPRIWLPRSAPTSSRFTACVHHRNMVEGGGAGTRHSTDSVERWSSHAHLGVDGATTTKRASSPGRVSSTPMTYRQP